jgi:hypothetical protein
VEDVQQLLLLVKTAVPVSGLIAAICEPV